MAEQNPQSHDTDATEVETAAEQSADRDPTPEEALDAAGRAAEEIKRETGDGTGAADGNSDDAAAAATAPAGESSATANPDDETSAPQGKPLDLESFDASVDDEQAVTVAGLNLLDDIDLQVTVELGRTRMYIEDVLRLNEHSVVELDKAAGDSVDIYVNERLVARGEVLVLNENFCVRINEIISQQALDEYEAVSGEQPRS